MSLVVITNLFPNPLEPQRSTFNERQLVALGRRRPVLVISPVSWIQKLRFAVSGKLSRLGACREWDGVAVRYPTYFYVPRTLAWLRGVTMALSIAAATLSAVRERRPAAILATWAFPDAYAAVLLGRLARVPVVVKVHGTDVENLGSRGLRRRLALWGLARADKVISVSGYLERELVRQGLAPARIAVVRNGVDATTFAPRDRNACRAELGLPTEGRLVLFVGGLKRDKGLLELLHPATIAACRREGARIAIIGRGELEQTLRREIAARSLESDVRLVGARPPREVASWMNAADALCLPSHHEGLPNVILEALSCGVPVLATRVGGIPEIVGETNGVLVEARDPQALAEGMGRLLSRDWDRAAIRAASPARSWEASAAALDDAIAACLEGR